MVWPLPLLHVTFFLLLSVPTIQLMIGAGWLMILNWIISILCSLLIFLSLSPSVGSPSHIHITLLARNGASQKAEEKKKYIQIIVAHTPRHIHCTVYVYSVHFHTHSHKTKSEHSKRNPKNGSTLYASRLDSTRLSLCCPSNPIIKTPIHSF